MTRRKASTGTKVVIGALVGAALLVLAVQMPSPDGDGPVRRGAVRHGPQLRCRRVRRARWLRKRAWPWGTPATRPAPRPPR